MDLLLHRYQNIDYIMALDLETGLQLILKAQEKEREDRIFSQWVAQLPVMALGDNVIGFEEYRDWVTGANIDVRPVSEILQELDEVEKQFEEGGAAHGS